MITNRQSLPKSPCLGSTISTLPAALLSNPHSSLRPLFSDQHSRNHGLGSASAPRAARPPAAPPPAPAAQFPAPPRPLQRATGAVPRCRHAACSCSTSDRRAYMCTHAHPITRAEDEFDAEESAAAAPDAFADEDDDAKDAWDDSVRLRLRCCAPPTAASMRSCSRLRLGRTAGILLV